MKYKLKATLAKLLLPLTLIAISSSGLNAQRGGSAFYTSFQFTHGGSQQNHPFYVQPAPLPQWIPPSATSGFHPNRNYNYPVPSSPNVPRPNIPVPTRHFRATEAGLIYFNRDYSYAFASRLEKNSGASFEEIVADRDHLLSQASQIRTNIVEAKNRVRGSLAHIDRAAYDHQLKHLDQAVSILSNERAAFFNEAYTISFNARYTSFNQKKSELDGLIASLNQKLQNEDYADTKTENLNARHAELLSIFEIIKIEGAVLGHNEQSNPAFLANQQALDAAISSIDVLRSDFSNQVELYFQRSSVLHSLLIDLNRKLQDDTYSDDDYQNLSTIHDNLFLLFQKIRTQGSFFGFNPPTNAEYIEMKEDLAAARTYIEESHQFYENRQYGEILHFEAETLRLAEELQNFNSIFTGLQAPNMESFNNLMSSFLGKEGSSELDSSTTASFDLNIAGDYVLSSFKYQDDKANVYMEIARVMKVDDCQTSLQDDGLTWDNLSDHSLILSSIRVLEQTREVTLAFYREGEQILLQSDLSSMNNYVVQKNMESYIFLYSPSASMPPINLDTIPTFGLKDRASAFGREFLSALLDFIPLVGSSKSITELLYGYDAFTGQPVPYVVSIFAIAGSVIPIPGAKNVVKFIGTSIDNSAKAVDKAVIGAQQTITQLLRSNRGKAIGGEALRYIKEGETWLRGTADNAGRVPKQIADKLRNLEFRNWDHFRQTFWKEVANDPVLSKSFTVDDLSAMKLKGIAPISAIEQQMGQIKSYQIHHINPIHNGGKVYDVDNLLIVTPRYHKEILDPKFHYIRK